MSAPDTHSIARQLAVLEERMNTQQADYRAGWEAIRANMAEHQRDYRTSIARLAEDMAKRDTDIRTDIAQRDTEAARRETRMLLAIAGMIGLAVAILRFAPAQ
ncbi:MAG: hypothetical protein GDA52_01330 [Rhodobacteraceae bacterium]|nr:hypothetical protein [Paracoccaceae bacterium]